MLKQIFQYIERNKVLVFAAAIVLLIKITYLDQLFLLRGERDITLTGYSLAKTAKDLYGNLLPLEFNKLDMGTPFLAFYYSALWWLFMPFRSVFFARLPYVFISLSLIFLVYEIIYTITKNKKLSILTSLFFSFSPGVFHLTRLSLEIGLAMPLLLSGILLYLKDKKFISYIFFLLSFFTYNGFRPIIPFMLVYLEFFFFLQKKRVKDFIFQNAINIVFFVLLFSASYAFIDGHMMMSRKTDVVFFSKEKIDNLVIFRRNTAVGPTILKQIFNNKLTSTAYYMIDVLVRGQDLRYLFLKGDDAAIYATTFTGQFFLMTMFLYYLGFIYLAKKWDKKYFYVLGIIPVSLVSSMVNIDYISVAIRSMPASIGYAFVIAGGALIAWDIISKLRKPARVAIIGIFLFLSCIEFMYFVYNYYFRRPVTMSESFFESEKQLAQYLINHKKNYIIYDDSPRNIFATYQFFNPALDMKDVQKKMTVGQPYHFDGYTLYMCPSSPKELKITHNTIIADSCTDIPLYEKLNGDKKIEKIKFKDFSLKTAFFVIN